MHFIQNEIYHVYNRGNNKQLIFFNDNNYIFFLKKIRKEWRKYCDLLCYCLMPNHFHFMLIPNEEGCKNIILGERVTHMQTLSMVIGKTLSSYTKAINIQNQTSGNLFQKKTQAKCLTADDRDQLTYYLLTCFHYIHQNPLQANLVKKLKDWNYSSYPDYYGYRNGTLCNKVIAMEQLFLSETDLKNEEVVSLNKEIIIRLY
jgi:putative transposase